MAKVEKPYVVRDSSGFVHEQVYRAMRARLINGDVEPGQALTLRGLAAEHDVSLTPARVAVKRLASEGALNLNASGRITVPTLSNERIEELAALRALLEPDLASRAMPRARAALIERMTQINEQLREALIAGDAVSYVRHNLEFHRTLYLRAQAPVMLSLVETVWLQSGPSMRALYSPERVDEVSTSHSKILSYLRAGDEPGVRVALRADVTAGLRRLMR